MRSPAADRLPGCGWFGSVGSSRPVRPLADPQGSGLRGCTVRLPDRRGGDFSGHRRRLPGDERLRPAGQDTVFRPASQPTLGKAVRVRGLRPVCHPSRAKVLPDPSERTCRRVPQAGPDCNGRFSGRARRARAGCPAGYGRASSTMLNWFSATRRMLPYPASVSTARSRDSPACEPRPWPTGCESEAGTHRNVDAA
jgi:hypothetical protein